MISDLSMKSYVKIMLLLCMFHLMYTSHAQEKSDLKGTSCVPVMELTEDALAFKAGAFLCKKRQTRCGIRYAVRFAKSAL